MSKKKVRFWWDAAVAQCGWLWFESTFMRWGATAMNHVTMQEQEHEASARSTITQLTTGISAGALSVRHAVVSQPLLC
eukprot:38642-Amphidinium_carterae.1